MPLMNTNGGRALAYIDVPVDASNAPNATATCTGTGTSFASPCPLNMRRVAMHLNDEACNFSEEGKYSDATEVLRQALILAVSSVADPVSPASGPTTATTSSSPSRCCCLLPSSDAEHKLPSLLPVFHEDMSPQAHLHHVHFNKLAEDVGNSSAITTSTLSAALMFNLALMYRKKGSIDEAARLNGMAVSALQTGAGFDGTGAAVANAARNDDECMLYVYALNNLAECYYQQGRRDEAARALAEAARAARWSINVLQQQQQQQQELDQCHHLTTVLVKTMNNLGLLHYQAGDFNECLFLLEDALGAAENCSEEKDNFATIQIYYNIGLVLESMASKEVSATTADLASCIPTEDLAHRASGMYKSAQAMVLRLIAKSTDGDLRQKYGEYTPRICVLVINKMALIGCPSTRNGASQDNLLLRHEALHRRLDVSFREGLDGAELAAEINGIGAAYSDIDEHLMALAMYSEGLRLEMAVLGPNNTNVLVTLNNIGQSNHIRGNYDAALSCYKKALDIRDGLSGQADLFPVTPTLFHNTALIHMHTGRQSDALSYFRASLSLQRTAVESGVTSCDKDVLASTLFNIGTIMADEGCLEEACKALTESIAIRSSTNSDDIDIAEAHAKLAQIHYARGKKMEALHSYKSILDLNLSTQDEACRSMIIQAFSNTAAICHSTGNLDESLNHYRSALDLLNAHSTNPSTDETLDIRTRTKIVSVLGAIAGIHSERGEVSEAESYYIERTRIQRVGYSDDETMAVCGTNVAAPAA